MESVYEQMFYLKHNGGWSFIELYNLPVGLRGWFFKRLIKYFKDQSEEIEKNNKK